MTVPLQIMLKPFLSGVLEDRYNTLSYQILHGMINDFLGSFDIERKRERRKERKKKNQCILTVSLTLVAEGQGPRAEPLCCFVLASKSSGEGADLAWCKSCRIRMWTAFNNGSMLWKDTKKVFFLWCIQILKNKVIFSGHSQCHYFVQR